MLKSFLLKKSGSGSWLDLCCVEPELQIAINRTAMVDYASQVYNYLYHAVSGVAIKEGCMQIILKYVKKNGQSSPSPPLYSDVNKDSSHKGDKANLRN